MWSTQSAQVGAFIHLVRQPGATGLLRRLVLLAANQHPQTSRRLNCEPQSPR